MTRLGVTSYLIQFVPKKNYIKPYSLGLPLFTICIFFNLAFTGTIEAQRPFCSDRTPIEQTVINVPISSIPTTDATVEIMVEFCGDLDGSAGGPNDEAIMLEDETMMPLTTLRGTQCDVHSASFVLTQSQYNTFVADGVFTVTTMMTIAVNPVLCERGCGDYIQLCFPDGDISQAIPTMGEWGLICLSLLLLILGVKAVQQRDNILA